STSTPNTAPADERKRTMMSASVQPTVGETRWKLAASWHSQKRRRGENGGNSPLFAFGTVSAMILA
ncbi:MAG TPA: hypothetical protein VF704_01225, partial [Allosphingosinicella sp.]